MTAPFPVDKNNFLRSENIVQIKEDLGTSALKTSFFLVDVIDSEHY